MIYGEPKSASAVLPIVAILMAMAGCILVLLSNVDRGDEKQGRVFVPVEQRELGK
ncbi:hypothetical protein [Rhizobium sp. OAE497]|uniref:hypothetical protein n=1 Tax=unclassified Rhizobium TaxID=2613769 RepID=UPI0010D67BFE